MAKTAPKKSGVQKKSKAKTAPAKIASVETVVKTAVKIAAAKNAPKKSAAPARHAYFYAKGKRKTAIASVRLFQAGKGTVTINQRTFENYFPVFTDQDKILSPLKLTNTQKQFDISVQVAGGGIHSQAEAIRHGIAKALLEFNAGLRSVIKPAGFLTRDARVKERKKYGLHRARRAPQWQKR